MDETDDVLIEPEVEESIGESEEDVEAIEGRAETKIAKLRADIEQLRAEKQENLDGWQRSKADYVNALRRFEEDRKAALEQGKIKAAEAFMPAMDSLERAKSAGQLPDSFSGVLKQFEGAAKSLDLVQFGEVGEAFDHNLHEALGQDATDTKEKDDTVLTVLESGWKIGDRVLRPAKVRVAHFEG